MPLGYATFRVPHALMRELSAIALVLGEGQPEDAPDVTPMDALAWALDLALDKLRSEGRVSGELEAWLAQEDSRPNQGGCGVVVGCGLGVATFKGM